MSHGEGWHYISLDVTWSAPMDWPAWLARISAGLPSPGNHHSTPTIPGVGRLLKCCTRLSLLQEIYGGAAAVARGRVSAAQP